MTRTEQEERLVLALVYVREHPEIVLTRSNMQTVARRFWVSYPTAKAGGFSLY